MAPAGHARHGHGADPTKGARLRQLAAGAAVAVAIGLVAVKGAAWLDTGSVAMLGSLVDSCIDAVISLVNLWAIRYALAPADREHRFGHGKAEAVAGLGQAAFIAGSAVFLLFVSANRLLHPAPVENAETGIAVMAFAIVVTLGLVLFQRYVVRRTESVAIAADSLHYRGDLLMNLSVIVALVLATRLEWHIADPIFAIGVAAYILHGAWTILRRSLDFVMDREFPRQTRREIVDIAMAHAAVLAVHDLRTRSSGIHTFIQLHLEMEGEMSLHRAHQIADEVEAKINARFPEAEVIIHQDPAGLDEGHRTFA